MRTNIFHTVPLNANYCHCCYAMLSATFGCPNLRVFNEDRPERAPHIPSLPLPASTSEHQPYQ
jgi:hypothetical protein